MQVAAEEAPTVKQNDVIATTNHRVRWWWQLSRCIWLQSFGSKRHE
jgi:hypothetical protein